MDSDKTVLVTAPLFLTLSPLPPRLLEVTWTSPVRPAPPRSTTRRRLVPPNLVAGKAAAARWGTAASSGDPEDRQGAGE